MNQSLRQTLDNLVNDENFYYINESKVKILKWKLRELDIILSVSDENKSKFNITLGIDKLLQQIGTVEVSNKYTINYLRKKLIDNIEKIESGKLETDRAKEISNHVQAIVNMTKLELEYRIKFEKGDVKFLKD